MERTGALLAALVVLATAGCPGTARPGGSPPLDSSASPAAKAPEAEAASVGSGTLDLLVLDDRERPIEGAVVWAPNLRSNAAPPGTPVVIEQEGLEFRPRFLVARKGQTLEVRNGDTENHNVHSTDSCCEWNVMVPIGATSSRILDQAGEVTFLCNIHAHMRCTLLVLDSPSAATDASGHARLELPLGARRLRVRAQDRERAELDVTVAAVTTARVTLAPLPQGPLVVPPEQLPWPTLAVRVGEALEEAVKRARAGDGDGARSAAEEAESKWFSGSGLFGAIRAFEGETPEHPRGTAEDLKGQLRRMPLKAENAAAQGREAADQLGRQATRLENLLLDIARKLPKR
jgi:plastocyanin